MKWCTNLFDSVPPHLSNLARFFKNLIAFWILSYGATYNDLEKDWNRKNWDEWLEL